MVTRVWGSGGRPRKTVKLCSAALMFAGRGKSSSEYLEVVNRSALRILAAAVPRYCAQNLTTCVLSADDPPCSKAGPGVKDFLGNHCARLAQRR